MKQRADFYDEENAITIIKNGQLQSISYSLLWEKVINVAKALSHFEKFSKPIVIGLLTNNQINGSLIDLACLSFGIKVVPIPLNLTSQHVSYIIDHAEITQKKTEMSPVPHHEVPPLRGTSKLELARSDCSDWIMVDNEV